jgi:adhesin transport system membrane fusion protein
MGSFAGKVTLIDATDDGKGHFRLLVTPDPHDLPWPSDRFLRQGVRSNGWVLLGRVTLGYELWRIFNNFPPLVLPEHALDKADKGKDKSDDAGKKKDEDKKADEND